MSYDDSAEGKITDRLMGPLSFGLEKDLKPEIYNPIYKAVSILVYAGKEDNAERLVKAIEQAIEEP